MSELKLDQIQQVFKNLGLEDDEIQKVASGEIEDINPLVDKMKSSLKENILADPAFLEEVSRPFKDAPIGKENQLKKSVRKFYGLQMTEEELKKTPFDDLLKRADETRGSKVAGDLESVRQEATKWMEKYEELEAKIPGMISETENKWQSKLREKDIREELLELAAVEANGIVKENLPKYVTTLVGYANVSGHSFSKDESGKLRVLGSDGLPLKNEQGHIVKPKDYIKEFSSIMNTNVAPKGGGSTPQLVKGNDLLQLMGKGL